MIANYTDVEAKKLMLSIMQHITNQITANVLKNLNNMKKVVISFIGFVTFIAACILFSSCEKTCMEWSCNTHKVDKNGEQIWVHTSAPNGHIYGEKNCICIDEVNRYTGK